MAQVYTLTMGIDTKVLYAYRRTLLERLAEAQQTLWRAQELSPYKVREAEASIAALNYALRTLAAFEVLRGVMMGRPKDE